MPGVREHHAPDLADLVRRLDADLSSGLTSADARTRLARDGSNALTEVVGRPRWMRFLDQFRNVLVAMLLVGAVLAGAFGDLKDAIVIGIVLFLNAVLGYVQEQRSAAGIAALHEMLTFRSRVRRDDRVVQVDTSELVPGDVVLVEAGDRVPADGRIIESHQFEVDESALTGESVPVAKEPISAGMPVDVPLADRRGCVYLHTQVTRGRAVVLVAATGDETEIGAIAALVAAEPEESTPLQQQLDRLGKVLAAVSSAVVGAYLVLGIANGRGVAETFVSAVALLIAAIPEGLPAVVTLTLALGTTRLAQRGAIVKHLRSVETLGSASVICSDKTGTLTLNQMTVEQVAVLDGSVPVTGSGYAADGSVGPGIDAEVVTSLGRIAALCNDSHVRAGQLVGDPTEGALVVFAGKTGIDVDAARRERPRLAEVPFDSDARLMVTAHPRRADGEGSEVLVGVKGAFEEVVARCATVCTSAGDVVTLDAQAQGRLTDIATELADQGMRIIAIADRVDAELGDLSSEGFARAGLRLLGLVAMVDPPRSEVRAAIKACRSAGISVKMITGDHVATAAAIAHDVGISGAARAGSDIDRLDDDELAADIGEIGVFARSSPAHKMRIISALRARGQVVAMTGDGVNDAPALRAADIGVAMGRTGTEVAKEAADLVLATDDFTTIVGAVREGRVIFDNIVKFVRFQLATNIGALVTIMVAELIGMPTPFSPIQILWINLIMDGPPALALSVDPAASGVMARPPRPLGGQILPMRRLLRVAVVGGVMAAGTLGFFTLAQREWGTSVALTGAFSTFVLFQVVNALGVRDEHRSMFSRRSLTNPALWSALGLVVVLQVLVVEVPFAQDLFTTTSLSGVQWAAVVAAALLFLVVQQGFVVVMGRSERS